VDFRIRQPISYPGVFTFLNRTLNSWGRTVMWLFLDTVVPVKFLDVSGRKGTALQVL